MGQCGRLPPVELPPNEHPRLRWGSILRLGVLSMGTVWVNTHRPHHRIRAQKCSTKFSATRRCRSLDGRRTHRGHEGDRGKNCLGEGERSATRKRKAIATALLVELRDVEIVVRGCNRRAEFDGWFRRHCSVVASRYADAPAIRPKRAQSRPRVRCGT